MLRCLVVLVLLGGVASADNAKRTAAIKVLLKQQIDMWSRGESDDRALEEFTATLTPDGRISRNGDWLRPDLMLAPPYNLEDLKIVSQQVGWSGDFGWAVAEVTMTEKMYAEPEGAGDPHPKRGPWSIHWIEAFVADGDGVKGRAVGVYSNKADKDLDLDDAKRHVVATAPPASLAALASFKDTAMATDPTVAVMGTSLGETAYGPAAVKKLLARWAKIPLEIIDTTDKHDALFFTPVEIHAGGATIVWGMMRMKLGASWLAISAFGIANAKHEYVALAFAAE
jgi:hypothetical protein